LDPLITGDTWKVVSGFQIEELLTSVKQLITNTQPQAVHIGFPAAHNNGFSRSLPRNDMISSYD
jgi:hypothetical protein